MLKFRDKQLIVLDKTNANNTNYIKKQNEYRTTLADKEFQQKPPLLAGQQHQIPLFL